MVDRRKQTLVAVELLKDLIPTANPMAFDYDPRLVENLLHVITLARVRIYADKLLQSITPRKIVRDSATNRCLYYCSPL